MHSSKKPDRAVRRAALFAALMLSVCAAAVPGPIPTTSAVAPGVIPDFIPTVTSPPATPTSAATASQNTTDTLIVAFVKDVDIHLWEESTHQRRTIVKAGDVVSLTMSDDRQAYAIKDHNLSPRCQDATQDTQVCGEPVSLAISSNSITSLQWVDSERFLVANILALGKLDGTFVPVVTWEENDHPRSCLLACCEKNPKIDFFLRICTM